MCCGLHMWTCDLRLAWWPVSFLDIFPLPAACGLVLSSLLSVISLSEKQLMESNTGSKFPCGLEVYIQSNVKWPNT